MKINVCVQSRASNQKVICNEDGSLKVYVRSPAVEGKANKEMLELLSKKFDVPKTLIKIVSGHNNRNKIIELP
ncbi:MAG: DUF167 domain-containing protein [Candidatus Omnitrophica bacterium]|nr:DUF167 domain-containing protein [Candidatus Omnitrophota bacterium]MCK4423203.1 DUF167 domain-containing protein [Candidatus Omnitrophota bacterium]